MRTSPIDESIFPIPLHCFRDFSDCRLFTRKVTISLGTCAAISLLSPL
jgi:hypothetical protein